MLNGTVGINGLNSELNAEFCLVIDREKCNYCMNLVCLIRLSCVSWVPDYISGLSVYLMLLFDVKKK